MGSQGEAALCDTFPETGLKQSPISLHQLNITPHKKPPQKKEAALLFLLHPVKTRP